MAKTLCDIRGSLKGRIVYRPYHVNDLGKVIGEAESYVPRKGTENDGYIRVKVKWLKDGVFEYIDTLCLNDFESVVLEAEKKAKNYRNVFKQAKAQK